MPNFSPYSNYGYASLIKETTEGSVPGIPTNYFRIISETLSANFTNQEINEISGDRERRQRSIAGQIETSGEITIFVEEKMIGHFLTSIFGAATDQTLVANTSYRHTWSVTNTPKTYTIDAQRADAPWAHRYFGVYFTTIEFSKSDNGMQATITCTPRKVFQNARVTSAVNSGTTLAVDQTSGLHAEDTILVLDKADGFTTVKELAITSVDSEVSLTVATIDVQLDVGDIVVIKSATTYTYSQCDPFQFMHGTVFKTGADIDNTAEMTVEDFTLSLGNEVEARYGSGGNEINRFPYAMIVKGYTAEGSITKYYDSETYLDLLRKNAKFPLRVTMLGTEVLSANTAVAASSTWGASNGFSVTASTAGKASNDINVTLVIAADNTLAVTKSGNNYTVFLANATAASNTGTAIAALLDALSDIASAAVGTGATQFIAAEDNANLGIKSSGTNIVGRDASEKAYLEIDFSNSILGEFSPSNEEDNIIPQEIPFTIFKDNDCANAIRKNWSTRIKLVNSISTY